MREIKFRYWHKKCKVMSGICSSLQGEIEFNNANFEYYDVNWVYENNHNDIIEMQLTGLKDKKGRYIYEGDIIETEYGKKKVYWHDKFACWAVTDFGDSLHLFHDKCEVIGNIYENAEIL